MEYNAMVHTLRSFLLLSFAFGIVYGLVPLGVEIIRVFLLDGAVVILSKCEEI